MEIATFLISITALIFSGYALWYKRKSYLIQEKQYKFNLKKENEIKQKGATESRPEFDPLANWLSIGPDYVAFNLINIGKEARNIQVKLYTDQDFLKLRQIPFVRRDTSETISIRIDKPRGTSFDDYIFTLEISFSDKYEGNFYFQKIECNKGDPFLSAVQRFNSK